MTLSTNIYVLGPVEDPDALFRWVNESLLHQNLENVRFSRKDRENSTHWANEPGQGFAAWFMMDVYKTPTLATDDLGDENSEWYEEDFEYATKKQEEIGDPYFALLNFDTAYSFQLFGAGCTELHVSYIIRLVEEYFKPLGIDIVWQNEYTGTHHRNLDIEGFQKFLGAGDSAMDWFRNTALPAIRALTLREES